jgi:hypothetical protein
MAREMIPAKSQKISAPIKSGMISLLMAIKKNKN